MATREELIARGLVRPATPLRYEVPAGSSGTAIAAAEPQVRKFTEPVLSEPATSTSAFELPLFPFSRVADLHAAIKALEPSDFVSHYLLERTPFAFAGDSTSWIQWKTKLASTLHVDPREIVIIGSAAIGFSLNPANNFSAFHKDSDIDIGIVSQHYFELAWRYLRQRRPDWLSLSPDAKYAIKTHRRHYVFEGTIATDFILSLLPFGQEWQAGLDAMTKHKPTNGRDIKARIYRDFESLRFYHSQGVARIKMYLETPREEDEEAIPIEG